MSIPFALNNPSGTHILDDPLEEISGICLMNRDMLACVQDEKVKIYQYDLKKERILSVTNLHKDGDAESIVVLGKTAYILVVDSPPAIYRVTNFESPSRKFHKHELPLTEDDDPEGMSHDGNGGLLIACKGPKGKNNKDVYKVKLNDFKKSDKIKKSQLKALFTVKSKELRGNGSNKTFNPSGIAVDPKTEDIYLISTKSMKMVAHYSKSGNRLKDKQSLDAKIFKQPEGIAFSKRGKQLFISSEKKDGKKARIFRFKRQ